MNQYSFRVKLSTIIIAINCLLMSCYVKPSSSSTSSVDRFIKESKENAQTSADSYKGAPKQALIQKMGPPKMVSSDGSGGEILSYQFLFPLKDEIGRNVYVRITSHFYVNPSGVIYHSLVQQEFF